MSGLIPENQVGTASDPLAQAIAQLAEFKRPKRILFVEDDGGMRELFGRLAECFNCEVDYAIDGEEGLHKALSGKFDMIMIDVILPGMDGVELFRQIREKLGDEPRVAFFTGTLDPERGRRADKVGYAAFIQKPYQFNERYITSFFKDFGITKKEP